MSDDSSTRVITNIKEALAASDKEAEKLPPALLGVGGKFNGHLFSLEEDKSYIIGRGLTNEIVLEVEDISRKHCEVEVGENNVVLKDLESKNGTFLNNDRVNTPVTLRKGDIIKIGQHAFKFLPRGDTERLSYDKLQKDANIDKWTGAYNKAYFNRALGHEFKKSKLEGSPLSLIILDLDHFKKVNDDYGHDAGDYVLKTLADIILKSSIRKNDVFARYGGEEFVILLPGINLKISYNIAERLRIQIENFNFMYEGKKLEVTASIGISDYRMGVKSGGDLFKRADKAVYKAKKNGRNQVCFFKE
jgi:diguanylate cyclase (GGDEF)-like protein